jgi:D-beta-D-heptose 7-phosphate kinase/D-beta-D-heptose 1-phosphate adenosyltransferase
VSDDLVKEAAPSRSGDFGQVLEGFANARLWVVGDLMLDEYVEGEARRVSPEAPVQVLQVTGVRSSLGGAANVAHNLRALGAKVELCGVVGCDEAARTLLKSCEDLAVGTSGVLTLADRPTGRKVRAMARHQQLLRMDWESTAPVSDASATKAFASLCAREAPQTIVVSDYGKGFLAPGLLRSVMAYAQARNIPVLVDPKNDDLEGYRGARVVKPNLAEAGRLLRRELRADDHAGLQAASNIIFERTGCAAVVITCGDDGMVLSERDGPLRPIAGLRREVYDVTGAGDTVMAMLAMGVAVGADLLVSAHLANIAAGLVVGKVGTATVTTGEIAAALPPAAGKLLTRQVLRERARLWRLQGRRVVFTNGCFDLLHLGHLALLRTAASLGDVLVVAVNSDASVQRIKGANRPMVAESERAAILAALDFVDAVVIFPEDTPLAEIESVRPDVLVKGDDYRIDQIVGREQVEGWGGRVAIVPRIPEHSTSQLVERIRNG